MIVCYFGTKYANLNTCPICGESRWKVTLPRDNDEAAKKHVPQKLLRYFPITPRLQRLLMSATTSGFMLWHKEGLVRDGKMQHPADSKAWKHVEEIYKDIGMDYRNIRLGLHLISSIHLGW